MSKGNLIHWCFSPTTTAELNEILSSLSDSELVDVSKGSMRTAARIAWCEFAKRKGLFDFHVDFTMSEGVTKLQFTADAQAVHEGPVLGVRLNPTEE